MSLRMAVDCELRDFISTIRRDVQAYPACARSGLGICETSNSPPGYSEDLRMTACCACSHYGETHLPKQLKREKQIRCTRQLLVKRSVTMCRTTSCPNTRERRNDGRCTGPFDFRRRRRTVSDSGHRLAQRNEYLMHHRTRVIDWSPAKTCWLAAMS